MRRVVMIMDKSLVRVSKFLSLILRHKPEAIGMQLDPDGWLEIEALIANANRHGNAIALEQLHEVVATNDKQRFALSEDGLSIRANQGHSIAEVNLDLSPVTPPPLLYHGTVKQFLASIRERGLLKRSRNHVHLSQDRETAERVGGRRGEAVILTIASDKMYEGGHDFYVSANEVWLTEMVPVEFLDFP